MAAKSKRRSSPEPQKELHRAEDLTSPTQPIPQPPRPNKRLLQVSAVLLLAWFGFLAWMALFD